MSYEPRGLVRKLLNAMSEQPGREFPAVECAEIIGCDPRAVSAMTEYARREGLMSRRKVGVKFLYRAAAYAAEELRDKLANRPPPPKSRNPLKVVSKPPPPWVPDPDDPRISKVVPGWKPPVMVCVRQA
jgi:hypothetical protein